MSPQLTAMHSSLVRGLPSTAPIGASDEQTIFKTRPQLSIRPCLSASEDPMLLPSHRRDVCDNITLPFSAIILQVIL